MDLDATRNDYDYELRLETITIRMRLWILRAARRRWLVFFEAPDMSELQWRILLNSRQWRRLGLQRGRCQGDVSQDPRAGYCAKRSTSGVGLELGEPETFVCVSSPTRYLPGIAARCAKRRVRSVGRRMPSQAGVSGPGSRAASWMLRTPTWRGGPWRATE